jgi:hypothetical protein
MGTPGFGENKFPWRMLFQHQALSTLIDLEKFLENTDGRGISHPN